MPWRCGFSRALLSNVCATEVAPPDLFCDYVLTYKGRKLAAVEAKKESLSYTEGVRQAKDYATRLQCRIAYATNGHEIYQIDMVTGAGQADAQCADAPVQQYD